MGNPRQIDAMQFDQRAMDGLRWFKLRDLKRGLAQGCGGVDVYTLQARGDDAARGRVQALGEADPKGALLRAGDGIPA